MRAVAIGDDVALSGCESETPAVPQFGDQLALEDVHDVPALAPVICDVAGHVLDGPYANIADLSRSPARHTVLARMLGARDAWPVDRLKRGTFDLHDSVEPTPRSRRSK